MDSEKKDVCKYALIGTHLKNKRSAHIGHTFYIIQNEQIEMLHGASTPIMNVSGKVRRKCTARRVNG